MPQGVENEIFSTGFPTESDGHRNVTSIFISKVTVKDNRGGIFSHFYILPPGASKLLGYSLLNDCLHGE